jgi:osmotically-inducible protein OsmY
MAGQPGHPAAAELTVDPDDSVHPDPDRESSAVEADEWLVHLVAEALAGDPLVRGKHLDVTVQNCVVILEGQVESPAARKAAAARVWTVPGVYDVCNLLRAGR